MKTPILHWFLCASFVAVGSLCTTLFAQDDTDEVIIYVDASNSSNNKLTQMHTYGSSWNTAFRYLHDALRFGDPNATQIWIAKGNYYVDRGVGVEDQTTNNPASKSNYLNPFVVSNRNLIIYGGFAGTETSVDERDIENNPTYLDGNVYYKEAHTFPEPDNLYHSDNKFAKRIMVVYNSTLTLDGLTFQYVKGGTSAASGSQLDTEPDAGLGSFILANQSELTINNCLFQYGLEGDKGLMVYTANSSSGLMRISNSRFTHSGNAEELISFRFSPGDNIEAIVENTVFEDLDRNFRSSEKTHLFLLFSTVDIELRNILFYKNDYLNIAEVGFTSSSDSVDITLENVLVFDNNLDDTDFITALGGLTPDTVNLSVINSSFINNTTSGAIISTHERTGSNKLNLTMHNNVFYGNKTTEGGNTHTEILKTGSNQQFQSTNISHNATDKSDSKLITNLDFNDGVVDLSNTSLLTDLFVGTNDNDGNFVAKGADDKWLTADDGFVPNQSGALHNVGHNDAVANINKDIKGDARVQETTVDIGAYEHGTEEALSIEGLSAISELVLYPNPIRSSQEGNSLLGYVTDPSSKPTRLVLRDLGGKLVRDLPIEDSGKGIDLGVLPSATYLAILSTENKGYKSFKLVVE